LSNISLYRKYRSQTFGDLVGQGHIVRTLQNSLASGKFVHAYLFTGPRGTGKTSTARLLAKALNCEAGISAEPCNACATCQSIIVGQCFDVVEMDAASDSGVDDIREKIVEASQYAPGYCRYKIFILDEVHDLSAKAFDALLKTIEEPPEYLVFVLATTEYNKVPPTIRSRCQKYEFHRGSVADVASRLQYVASSENAQIEPAAIQVIARLADGGYRDALTFLEQALLTTEGTVTLQEVYDQLGMVSDDTIDQILVSLRTADIPKLLELLQSTYQHGRDPKAIVESALWRIADLMRAAYGMDTGFDAAQNASIHEAAVRIGVDALLGIRAEIATSLRAIRDVTLPKLWLESELIRIAKKLNQPISDTELRREAKPVAAQIAPPQPEQASSKNGTAKPMVEPQVRQSATVVEVPVTGAIDEQVPEGLREPTRIWLDAVKAVGQTSKTLCSKLQSTKVASFESNMLTVAFDRRIEHDFVVNGVTAPQKKAAIQDAVHKAGGTGWTLKYSFVANGKADEEPAAVELPLTGKSLHDQVNEAVAKGTSGEFES
jgi:DNA polymerase-3 subunit gamma/tau